MSGRALVTGGTGFVGSAVVRTLLDRGVSVRALVRRSSRLDNLEGLDVEAVYGDLDDPTTLGAAVTGCDRLFHAAADYRLWAPDPNALYRTNVEGTRSLLRAAGDAGIERVVYTSSVAALRPGTRDVPGTEADPVSEAEMIGDYKRSKFLAEAAAFEVGEEMGLDMVVVNPSTPMGPRDIKPTPTGRIVERALAGQMPAYVRTGLNIVHVDDVAHGHWLAYESGRRGERYILGGENLTLKEILDEVARLAGRPPPRFELRPEWLMPIAALAELWARGIGASEPFVSRDALRMSKHTMFFSSEKAKRELGYAHRPAIDAIRDAVEWFRGR